MHKPLPMKRLASGLMVAALIAAIIGGLLGPVDMAQAGGSVALSLTATEEKAADALLIGAIAAFFGVDTQIAIDLRSRYTPVQAITLLYFSGKAKIPVEKMKKERKGGKQWGRLAKAYGLPPHFHGTWVSEQAKGKGKGKGNGKQFVVWTDAELERLTFTYFVAEYYGVPQTDVTVWLRSGFTYSDILLIANTSKRARVEPIKIIELRKKGKHWQEITKVYGIAFDEASKPATPSLTLSITIQING